MVTSDRIQQKAKHFGCSQITGTKTNNRKGIVMSKIQYLAKNFRPHSRAIINLANEIIEEYQGQGYDLTLRQLYYQFVARDLISNTQKDYHNLGTIISNARLAGLIDWKAIIDRTRSTVSNSHWADPQEIIEACADSYRIDTRTTQDSYVEVWVEKEALAGVIEKTCRRLDVLSFACRGYVSQSAMWEAAQRIGNQEESGKAATILHLGDHDPSGIDMTRDIQDRLCLFGSQVIVDRIALTMEQIEQYSPPPNPAKLTDSRCSNYIAEYGSESWELDALEPTVLDKLIASHVTELTNNTAIKSRLRQQEKDRKNLRQIII